MIKHTVLLVALVSSSAAVQSNTTSPVILDSVSSEQVSLLTLQEISETRGESIGFSGAIQLCKLMNIPFCDLSYDFDIELFSVSAPLPFGLGTVYLQQ